MDGYGTGGEREGGRDEGIEGKGSDGSRQCGWTEWREDKRERTEAVYWVKWGNERADAWKAPPPPVGLWSAHRGAGEREVSLSTWLRGSSTGKRRHRGQQSQTPAACALTPHATSCFHVWLASVSPGEPDFNSYAVHI